MERDGSFIHPLLDEPSQTLQQNDTMTKKLKEELLTTMLENMVWPVNDLHKVKTNADHKVTKGGAELIYKQYVTFSYLQLLLLMWRKLPKVDKP